MKYFLVVIVLIALLFFGFQEKVEAREATEPCSYLDKNHYIKISSNPWQCAKVNYWVPEKCGKIEGLYKTDPDCKPTISQTQPTSIPLPKPSQSSPPTLQENRESMSSGIIIGIVVLIVIIGIGIKIKSLTNQKNNSFFKTSGFSRSYNRFKKSCSFIVDPKSYGRPYNPPTSKQLDALDKLGYRGAKPKSSAHADRLIKKGFHKK